MWKFSCYLRSGGKNVIKEWYLALDKSAQAHIYSKLEFFKYQNKSQLQILKIIVANKESKSDIYEIRITFNKNQYRIIGYFMEDNDEFIMLDAFLKQNKSDNKQGFDRSKQRKKEIENDESRKEKYDFRAD